VVAVGCALFVVLAAAALTAPSGDRLGDPASAGDMRPSGVAVRPAVVPVDAAPTRAVPVRIAIDVIGVSAAVGAVGLDPDGTLALPGDPSAVGWYSGSSVPGDRGPAVMVGHVDSVNGPAVFIGLDNLQLGDVIDVEGGDGTIVSFAVSSVTRHPKDAFPTEAVYGPTPDAELRLLTCGGPFDRDSGYADNVVVAATAID